MSVPLPLPDGRVVGAIVWRDGRAVLRKQVDSRRHQLRRPPAWAIAEAHLELLEVEGGPSALVELEDERQRRWTATVEDFRRHGFPVERSGFEPQVALALAHWGLIDPAARQLPLPLEAAR
ncbi:hypothetical protein HRbin29_00648 [bacterium HR29]|nr:hypothetical protein HRbin29_00648 [bacterium HR29]